jgi:hypothetical protein
MNFILDERARTALGRTQKNRFGRFGKFTGGSYLWPMERWVSGGANTIF